MKELLTGNEAVARGAFEAGISYAAAYPGTPSTEILENIAPYKKEIVAEWAPNEKVAFESAMGASIAGARSLAAMKQVGLNVAADPFFTYAYTGVNGAMVLVDADDPSMHASQDEQDNRHYARFAKVAMLEPSDSQETKDMVKSAVEISERFDTLVLLRLTTRICHGKGLVSFGERNELGAKPYEKNIPKYVAVPANAKKLRVKLEGRLKDMEAFSNETPLNFIEWNDKKVGIVTSGVAYQYAKEVFGDSSSYLKLGFTNPLPIDKIKSFSKEVDTLYVIEELEPFMEEQIKAAGIECIGKDKIPNIGELNSDIIAKTLLNEERETVESCEDMVIGRPPTMCAGCPHRGFFYELSKKKNIMVTGDIGCYGLGAAEPLSVMETCICMGASISSGHGAQKAFNRHGVDRKVVAVLGDSTFFHSGITGLLDVAYNRSNIVTVILDNRITAMTGHQQNPGTGFTLQGMPAKQANISAIVKALGIDHIKTVNPIKLDEMRAAIDWALALDEPSVIITRWPCVLKKQSEQDVEEFGDYKSLCVVDADKCIGCKMCINIGCPALTFDKKNKKALIDEAQCVGCEVCLQVCPVKAIEKVGE